jgi:hypothetical protein
VALDSDLVAILSVSKKRKTSEPAGPFLHKHRKNLVDHIARWTSMQRPQIRKLMESIENRTTELGLRVDVKREAEYLSELTVFVTTLVMNHLARGRSFQA